MANSKDKPKRPIPVNGPFSLQPIDGYRRFGLTGDVANAPLVVQAIGNDGEFPHDKNGKVLPIQVAFKTIQTPEGAETKLVSGSRKQMVIETDNNGRAMVPVQLGKIPGRYIFEAAPVKMEESVGVDFTVLTEGVVASIIPEPTKPTTVGRALRVQVRAYDWLGKPVSDAQLEAVVAMPFEQNEIPFYQAKELSGGRYRFSINHEVAGQFDVDIVDVATYTQALVPITLTPGVIRSLDFLEPDNPREQAPYNVTRLDVIASDQYGNFIPNAEVNWSSSGGKLLPLNASKGVSASASLQFLKETEIEIKVSSGRVQARHQMTLPGTYVRFVETKDFAFTGERFHVWVEVFPPPIGGTVETINACILHPDPEVAKFIGVSQPHPENGLPPATVAENKGMLDICVEGAEVAIPKYDSKLVVAELEYECCEENAPACFEVMPGTITIARSPGEDFPLPADFRRCPDQKRKRPRKLCLNICIAVKPGSPKTFAQHKREVEAQVARTQTIFDENIPNCCPKIQVKACINELNWRTYNNIVKDGEVRGALERQIYTNPAGNSNYNNDEDKDKIPLSSELKNLLKQCRKANCISIYYVPDHRYKSGNTWRSSSNGTTISPRDYPETTGARGSGPGLVLSQNLTVNDHTLVHELGHMLIDVQRDPGRGDEHVDDANRDRVMKRSAPGGRKFIRTECERIFRNIGQFGGDC